MTKSIMRSDRAERSFKIYTFFSNNGDNQLRQHDNCQMIINKLNLHFKKMRSLCISGTCSIRSIKLSLSAIFLCDILIFFTCHNSEVVFLKLFVPFKLFYFISNFLFPNDKSFHLSSYC